VTESARSLNLLAANLAARIVSFAIAAGMAVLLAGCANAPVSPSTRPSASPAAPAASAQSPAGGSAEASATPEAAFTPIPDASQAPDTGNGAAAGDVPDNAVFLTYQSAAWRFSIQYVEGWQVRTMNDGVVIRDKDSSETVTIVQKPADVAAWVKQTDLPALQSASGFKLVKQNQVKVGSATYVHLAYHAQAEPDPVTGKRVPSTVDRFYVPGPGLAIVTLSTPDGVDNVDAFRQMITSFKWS
jgi:hypothetical protein